MKHAKLFDNAKKTLGLIDLTNLNDVCTNDDIKKLCDSAMTKHGSVAAICIWPDFIKIARSLLGDSNQIQIATVVNFPNGEQPIEKVVAQTKKAIADGADEIDLVIPYKKLMSGDEAAVSEMVAGIKSICTQGVLLKVIIETGVLENAALIRNASHLAISEGANFIKTSTGKVPVNATEEAADLMLTAIKESGKPVGFKAAGGIKTVEDASGYLTLAEIIHGKKWVKSANFRFGASSLLGNVIAVLDGGRQEAGGDKY